MPIKSELKKWLPSLHLKGWLHALPLLAMFAGLWIVACHALNLATGSVRFWEHVFYGWIYAVTGYFAGLVLILKYARQRWLAVLFAWAYLSIYGVNIMMLHHAGKVLKPLYLRMASDSNWKGYVTTEWTGMLFIFLFLNAILAAWLIWRHSPALVKFHARGLILLLLALGWLVHLNAHGRFRPVVLITQTTGVDAGKLWGVDQATSLRDVADNPLVILGWALFHRPQGLEARPASELAAAADTIKAWHLPLGERRYPPLGLKPFDHIVVFGAESLSLDFLEPYNTQLPAGLTSFYSSTTVTQAMFVNYRTVGLPSQPGITVMYNSHPNFGGLLFGNSELSLVKILRARGYETYYVMSASENFGNDKTIYGKIGFQHVLGTETWRMDPKEEPFLEERGLMDRALYDTVLNLLEQTRGKKVYIHVANMDTHGPFPREFFGPLQYPPPPDSLPQSVPDTHARAILAGIFRNDYDMGLTLQRMRERNLLTEGTLVVLTADHNYPPADYLRGVPGYPEGEYLRIPLAFFSGQPLPQADLQKPHSQLDFAPTIAHLLGLPVPPGWWGESVFAPDRQAPYVARLGPDIVVDYGGERKFISYDFPKSKDERGLVDLFKKVYVGPAETNLVNLNKTEPGQAASN